MSEAIKIDQVDAMALSRIATELEKMNAATLDGVPGIWMAEITARKEHEKNRV